MTGGGNIARDSRIAWKDILHECKELPGDVGWHLEQIDKSYAAEGIMYKRNGRKKGLLGCLAHRQMTVCKWAPLID